MKGLRKLGFTDIQIREQFRAFMSRSDHTGKRHKHLYYDFYGHLKSISVAASVKSRSAVGLSSTERAYSCVGWWAMQRVG